MAVLLQLRNRSGITGKCCICLAVYLLIMQLAWINAEKKKTNGGHATKVRQLDTHHGISPVNQTHLSRKEESLNIKTPRTAFKTSTNAMGNTSSSLLHVNKKNLVQEKQNKTGFESNHSNMTAATIRSHNSTAELSTKMLSTRNSTKGNSSTKQHGVSLGYNATSTDDRHEITIKRNSSTHHKLPVINGVNINLADFMKPENKSNRQHINYWSSGRQSHANLMQKMSLLSEATNINSNNNNNNNNNDNDNDNNKIKKDSTTTGKHKTEGEKITKPQDPTLLSFFENSAAVSQDDDNEYITELQNDGSEDGYNGDKEVLLNNAVLSSLITNKEINGLNSEDLPLSDSQSMFDSTSTNRNILEESPAKRNHLKDDSFDFSRYQRPGNLTPLTQNARVDLEDPDDSIATRMAKKITEFEKNDMIENNNIDDILKSYYKVHGTNLTATAATKNNSVESLITVPNPIRFIRVPTAFGAHCMDGSTPGYYLREGINEGKRKWIVHLHGGAWCYDLRSCSKRRNTILGSTKRSFDEDISGFFHGILSSDRKINPQFYNWNVAVLSYCDGGLFSGNRDSILKGKGKNFYFQGRKVLQSQLKSLQSNSLMSGSEIVLSGTSAGALALVIQGNFIKRYLPRTAKVRGLIDAGLFLDQDSVWNTSISSLQFKALYSLHRPTLSRRCLESQPRGKKYKCLFPEYAMKYVKIPLFIVSSLYDHWQLSYLEGVYCVYDDRKCGRNAHDRILNFRNKIYSAISEIVKDKPDTGVFANSCFAHGQVILDYTWSRVKINNKSISDSFYDWYKDNNINQSGKRHVNADCKYPCNGSCPRSLSRKCVNNFMKASEHRRKRDAELC